MSFNGVEEVYCALYVDFDNIFTRLYELDPELAHEFGSNPKRWVRWIEGHAVKILYGEGVRRRILKRVCYLNPRRYQEYRSYFTMAAFQVVDCPPMTRQEKTSTDIHLVMDCLDALHHQTHFGEFIILSGDSDFTPLLLRLQEYARKTLVLSVGYTSPAYASAATWRIREDWFITQSLEKEESSDEDYDGYDMDNHYEMLSMSQYRAERENRLNRTADGDHAGRDTGRDAGRDTGRDAGRDAGRHNALHDAHYNDSHDTSYDKHGNHDDHSHNYARDYSRDNSFDRSKRYDRNNRDTYEGRQTYNRDYDRQSFSSRRNDTAHADGEQNSSYGYDNNYKGRNGRKTRDDWAAYSPKKYLASHQYQSQQDYDEEESQVTIPVKVISYADVKKPSAKDVVDTSEDTSFVDLPAEYDAAYDEADALNKSDIAEHVADAVTADADIDADIDTEDAWDTDSDDALAEDFLDEQSHNNVGLAQADDEDAQDSDFKDDNADFENQNFDVEEESSHNTSSYSEDEPSESESSEFEPSKSDYDFEAQGDAISREVDDEPYTDADDEEVDGAEPDAELEDVEVDEDQARGDEAEGHSAEGKLFHGLRTASARGYASYASTLRQHGYADNDYDEDEDDEVNGNVAEGVTKSTISTKAAIILKKVVTEAPQPVPAANIGQILQRELGAGLDWFGFGKLRDFLDHLDLAPLEFSPVPPGYLYDPNRHDRPEERGNNDEFRNKFPKLFEFALNVHRLTDMPLLLPEHYKQVLGYIVEEVNTNGFFMTTTSRNVRDRCIEDGLPVARSHVNFIIVGVGRGGCPLNDKQGISMRDVAKAFLRNAYDLCRVAHMELGEQTMHQLMEWIIPKE